MEWFGGTPISDNGPGVCLECRGFSKFHRHQEARQQILEHRRQCKACQQDSCQKKQNPWGKCWSNSGLKGTLCSDCMEYYRISARFRMLIHVQSLQKTYENMVTSRFYEQQGLCAFQISKISCCIHLSSTIHTTTIVTIYNHENHVQPFPDRCALQTCRYPKQRFPEEPLPLPPPLPALPAAWLFWNWCPMNKKLMENRSPKTFGK